MIKKFKTHIIFCLSALIVGGLSVFLTRDNMMLYNEIVKPPLSPPAIVFVIVRSVLYILMGTSFAIVYMHKCENAELFYSAKRIYILQLIFNFFWSIIFFNYRSFLFSALWLAALCIMVFIMIIRFKKNQQSFRESANSLLYMDSVCIIPEHIRVFAEHTNCLKHTNKQKTT